MPKYQNQGKENQVMIDVFIIPFIMSFLMETYSFLVLLLGLDMNIFSVDSQHEKKSRIQILNN